MEIFPGSPNNKILSSFVLGKRRIRMDWKIFMFFLLGVPAMAAGQSPDSAEILQEQKYRERIQQEYLFGVYIPANLAEAINELNKLTSREARETFASRPEAEAVRKLHFSFGRWMIYNWGFYQGSRLSHSLKEEFGLSYPDDQARLIMIAYHRVLNQKPLELEAVAEKFKDYRQEKWAERVEQGEVLHEEKVDSIPPGKGKPNPKP
jgi:hypothetical protein